MIGSSMFSSGYETELSAQELASALMAIHTRQVTEEYLPVRLLSSNKPTLNVRLKLVDAVELANGGEVLHCITDDGKKVDFLMLYPPKDRVDGFLTAIALVEDIT